jgi:hypothetical protein
MLGIGAVTVPPQSAMVVVTSDDRPLAPFAMTTYESGTGSGGFVFFPLPPAARAAVIKVTATKQKIEIAMVNFRNFFIILSPLKIVFRTRRRSRNRKIAFGQHEEKRIEDEYDDAIIAGCVLPASYRRGEGWIALLVKFRSNIRISSVL